MPSIFIGALIVLLAAYVLFTSLHKEASDGCYACPSRGSCDKKNCGQKQLITKIGSLEQSMPPTLKK